MKAVSIFSNPNYIDLLQDNIYNSSFIANHYLSGNIGILNFTNQNSTNSKDINIENQKHIEKLRNNEFYFIRLLQESDFEDGNSNNAIEYISEQLSINSIATSVWMADFFSRYFLIEKNDEDVSGILYGLLRVIAYLNNENCFNYIKGELYLILIATFHKKNTPYLQEAGLMVVEAWRSTECLEILNKAEFTDKYIKSYAETIKKELQKELGVVSNC